MAKIQPWNKPSFSSYANKQHESAAAVTYHDQKNVAFLDDSAPFLERAGHYVASVDTSARELNESYFEHPMSGDDIAKMKDKRIPTTPTLKHWVDVPQDRANYEQRRHSTADQQAESNNPSKGM
jgi:hypothetical protein